MGDLECFFSEDAAPVLLDKGLHAETNRWPSAEFDWLATGNGYLPRHVVSFLQLLRLVRPRILKSFSPSYFMG